MFTLPQNFKTILDEAGSAANTLEEDKQGKVAEDMEGIKVINKITHTLEIQIGQRNKYKYVKQANDQEGKVSEEEEGIKVICVGLSR